MDRIEAWGVVDKLFNWIFGGIILSKGEVLPLIVVGDSKRGKECSDVRKGCLKTVDVIEKPKRDEIRNVIEATIGKHISVVRDCIVMVHVGHVSGKSFIQREELYRGHVRVRLGHPMVEEGWYV